MSNTKSIVPFERLSRSTNLTVDTVYEGGSSPSIASDPISKLLPVGNLGGFRRKHKEDNSKQHALVVLTTSGKDINWPDKLDHESGMFTYFGDNKIPGDIHRTKQGGNKLLKEVFTNLDSVKGRQQAPPFFIFESYPTKNSGRSMKFLGLAVPGTNHQTTTQENLIAVWRTNEDNSRFQNYQAFFTILNVNTIETSWINDLVKGTQDSSSIPSQWNKWVQHNIYEPLVAEKVVKTRTKQEQTPSNKIEKEVLDTILEYLDDSKFESFAAEIFKSIHKEKAIIDEITRRSSDGGRDAIGRLQIGLPDNPVYITFSLEAKFWNYKLKSNSVGVKTVSRLASRVKYREFGVVVTTSYFSNDAQKEVIDNRDRIILICGKDIAQMLINKNINSASRVKDYLKQLSY